MWFCLQAHIYVSFTHKVPSVSFCLLHKDEHHVWRLVLHPESPDGLGVLMLSRKGTEQSLHVYVCFPLLLSIARNPMSVCVCVCLSLATLTLDAFVVLLFFSPVAQGGCGVSFPVLSLNVS